MNHLPTAVSSRRTGDGQALCIQRNGLLLAASAKPQSSIRVLYVDKDAASRLVAQEALADGEFGVRTFEDGSVALEAMLQETPDIVIVDLVPEMDGLEFCSRLRNLSHCKDVPVLAITSTDDPQSVDRAYEAGATDFAARPVNWDLEKRRLRYMLRAFKASRQLKRRESETRLAKEEWERTFHSIKDVVTVLDLNLNVIHCNEAAVKAIGKPVGEIIGNPCYRLFRGLTSPCQECPVIRVKEKGTPQSVEMAYLAAESVWQVEASPIADDRGRLMRVVHVARDITERKTFEAQFRQAKKMEALGTLSGGVAHEFNNLIQIIMGYAGFLAKEAGPGEEIDAAHRVIVDAAMRGSTLTRQLLAFSRKGMVQTIKEPVDLNPLVEESKEMLQRILPKPVTILTRLAPHLGRTSADRGQLQQVLVNLAVNSAHAMPAGGTLTIETRNVRLGSECRGYHPHPPPGEYVALVVSDTGCGMDKKTLDRIYEPFFTTKKPGQGTGLGLSVVFGIINQHAGGIHCTSQPGKGTTFKICLPLFTQTTEDAPLSTPELKPRKSAEGGASESIMVVDDEQMIRRLVVQHLSEEGYCALGVGDGETAVESYREACVRPDLVILDLGMPGISGWECLARLREINPEVKVLLSTGYGGEDILARARREGATGVLTKPFQLNVLSQQLREVFQS